MNKKIVIGVAIIIGILAIFAWFFSGNGSTGQQVLNSDAPDTVINFYDQWLEAVKQPKTADPDLETLIKSPVLTKELSVRLKREAPGEAPDPVLCQTVIPEKVSARNIYLNESEAQMLVSSLDKSVTEQAVVTLVKSDKGWQINEITCSAGEFESEREFSFERVGHLLKDSIPAPYNSKDWHLVFEENGKLGHAAPLFFDSTSQCTSLSGTKALCKSDQFKEATKVSVRGQMSERGVSVKQLEFVK